MKLSYITVPAIVLLVSVGVVAELLDSNTENESGTPSKRIQDDGAVLTSKRVGGFSQYVDQVGKISLPKGYKQKWAHLGNWAVAKEQGKTIHEMHDVYTQPETIVAFNKTGRFPDGAVLVKEVREARADQLTTGHSAWSTDIKISSVSVRKKRRAAMGTSWETSVALKSQ